MTTNKRNFIKIETLRVKKIYESLFSFVGIIEAHFTKYQKISRCETVPLTISFLWEALFTAASRAAVQSYSLFLLAEPLCCFSG